MSASSTRVNLGTVVPERSTRTYSVTLRNQAGDPVPITEIDSITLSLVDVDTGFVIRNAQNVKNANDGTMHATSGLFSMELTSADNRVINPVRRPNGFEKRVLTLDIVYNNGDDRETREVTYKVEAFAAIR